MRFCTNIRPSIALPVLGILLFGVLVLTYCYSSFGEMKNKDVRVLEVLGLCQQDPVNFRRENCSCRTRDMLAPQGLLYKQPSVLKGRTNVVAVTPWLAPIVWEGTFNPLVVDSIYKPMHLSIATTVFAVGKYVRFLRDFLETAEKHFMVDFKVHYYIFTDRREDVPAVVLAPGRQVTIIPVTGSNRWQEISSRRMEMIQTTIENQISKEVDYIFCLDVDTKFYGRWGAETLSRLVAALHPGYYEQTHEHYPYERRPASRAYIPAGEGDYYYGGATIAGYVGDVHKLAKYCREQLEADAANSIEAAWQEESHLNRYLLYNKPTKILSPEYLWQDFKAKTNEVQIIRFSQVNKNYAEVRPNVKKRK
ncbi:globoside alpha-1,3-N-acetylgalactosaminyltransferase 1-like [Coregonus clupeaformis]|nr:globoside alpha-1,3-N-acetylgalactosaminyltransferase 1-like [Coregonus clupeaformis]